MNSNETQKQNNDALMEQEKDAKIKEAFKSLESFMERKKQATQQQLIASIAIAKFLDVFAVILLVSVIIIVITLFLNSLFEGFVSAVVGFWIVRYVFKKRNCDLLSKFFGWFSF